MLSLCNILMESQHKVSSAIEQSLRKEGVVLDPRPAPGPSTNPPTASTDDSTLLRAAALNRIEDLLTTVLGRLDGSPAASPEQSPTRLRKSSQPPPQPAQVQDVPDESTQPSAPVEKVSQRLRMSFKACSFISSSKTLLQSKVLLEAKVP